MPILFEPDELAFVELTPNDEQIENEPPPQHEQDLQSGPGHLTPEESPNLVDRTNQNSESPQGQISVRPAISNYPRSLFDGWEPPLPPTSESHAIEGLLQEYHRQAATAEHVDHIMLSLSDFRVYRSASLPEQKSMANREHELEALQNLGVGRAGCGYLLFDGILRTGSLEFFVQGVPFETLAIEGYGDSETHSVRDHISIQSVYASSAYNKVWYLLEEPSVDYFPYHKSFLWIADFTKHTIDYMTEHANVTLAHFKGKFHEWLEQQHGQNCTYQQWFLEFGQQDFRQAFNAHSRFLWKETNGLRDEPGDSFWDLIWAPVWTDVNFVPEETGEHSRKPKSSGKTVITPYVYQNFKHIAELARFFEVQKPKDRKTSNRWTQRKISMGFSDPQTAQSHAIGNSFFRGGKVRKGDFVVIKPDESIWKDGSESWYAYVQDIHKDRHGKRFEVIWLYPASATTLAGSVYPFSNELFFSSHCNCNEAALRIQDIVGKVDVKWLRNGPCIAIDGPDQYNFFMRQVYDTEEHRFISLKESHFLCPCKTQSAVVEEHVGKYPPGDTFLVPFTADGKLSKRPADGYAFSDIITDILEPVVVEKHLPGRISVRRLLRRGRDFGDKAARPNELVWTNDFLKVHPSLVGSKCHIRFFHQEELASIPPPYNRNGSGNCWVITACLNERQELENLSPPYPTSLNEGLESSAPPPRPRMNGLDVFAGGGNFGRGLAEGMAVDFHFAIDWERNAVQTYKANHSVQHHCWVYWGSVNDFLSEVMNGAHIEHFARIGNVDFIAAGSPCQGFSGLQQQKASDNSLRNISMVASVAAYVDLYRPRYALLENVVAMARRNNERLGMFPQLLSTLVGMGYQVSQHCLDAWSHGDPQRRSRLFISIAAPGLAPISAPPMTHSHPNGTYSSSLGRVVANDLKFGERRFAPTPFEYVSVQKAMGDLPNIGNSHIQTCIRVPDHHTVSTEAAWVRRMLAHIPISPPCQTAMTAIRAGAVPDEIARKFLGTRSKVRLGPSSKSWSRVPAHGLTSTITTSPAAACGINGRVLHYQQHRVLTIREARRAQGFDDTDVITGTPSQQWKIVGDSVSRAVALSLGMALQEAWLSNPPDLTSSLPPTLPISPAVSTQPTKPKSVVIDLTADSDDDIVPPGASAAGGPCRKAKSPMVILRPGQKRKRSLT